MMMMMKKRSGNESDNEMKKILLFRERIFPSKAAKASEGDFSQLTNIIWKKLYKNFHHLKV